MAAKYSDDNPDEAADFVSAARDQMQLEADLSRAARQFGYQLDRMSRDDWAGLAEDLREHSQQSLRYATDERRQAAGNKLRGKADFVAQVGGQDQLVHSSAFSARDARKHSRALADDSKTVSAAYIQMMLEHFSYHDHTTEGLNYDQRRRLLAEIGHGQTQPSRIGHIPDTLRKRAVQRATPGLRQAAALLSVIPRPPKASTPGNCTATPTNALASASRLIMQYTMKNSALNGFRFLIAPHYPAHCADEQRERGLAASLALRRWP